MPIAVCPENIIWKCMMSPYILKARIVTPTIPQTNLNFPQICPKMQQNGPKMAKNDPKWPKVAQIWPKMALEWPKMIQNGPKITQNGPKLPQMAQKWRPDLRTFSAIFFDWKDGFANFFAIRMYGSIFKLHGSSFDYWVSESCNARGGGIILMRIIQIQRCQDHGNWS